MRERLGAISRSVSKRKITETSCSPCKSTTRLSLSLIGQETAPALFEIIRREQDHLSQWLAWPIHTQRLADYLEHVQRVGHAYAEGQGMACCIHRHGEPVGSAGFNTIDRSLRKATIGYWLSEKHQGRGIPIDIAFSQGQNRS